MGYQCSFLGGEMIKNDSKDGINVIARNKGTTIQLEKLFFKNPIKAIHALSKNSLNEIEQIIKIFACHFPKVHFELKINTKIVYKNSTNYSKIESINHAFCELSKVKIFEFKNVLDKFLEFNICFTRPDESFNMKSIFLFINNRMAKHKDIFKAVTNSYKQAALSINKKTENYFVLIEIRVGAKYVDFNLSANKYEIKLVDESYIASELEKNLTEQIRERMNIKTYVNKISKFNCFSKDSILSNTLPPENDTKYDKFQLRSNPTKITLEEFYKSSQNGRFSGPKNKNENIEIVLENTKFQKAGKIVRLPRTNQEISENYTKNLITSESEDEKKMTIVFDILIPETSVLLMKSELVGVINAFALLLQKDNLLLFLNSTFLAIRYLEKEIKHLIMKSGVGTILEGFEVSDFEFDIDVFDSYFMKYGGNPKSSFENLKLNIEKVNQEMPNVFIASDDFSSLAFSIPPFLKNFVDSDSVHFLLFRLAKIPLSLVVFNFPDCLVKFYAFIMNNIKNLDDKLKMNLDHFYDRIFTELKKKEFGYLIEDQDDVHEILDIKNSYKYFERC